MKNVLLLFLILLSVSTSAQNCNVGNQSSTGYNNTADPITKNYLMGIKFTVANDGILTSLNLLGRNSGSTAKMALYKDNAGVPGDLVDSTSTSTVTNGVVSFAVTPAPIPAGNYWIMAIYKEDGKHTFSKKLAENKIYYKPMNFGSTIPSNAEDFSFMLNTTFTYFLGITCGTSLAALDPNNSSIISFYPNPATNAVTLNTNENLIGETYRITTISGTEIATGQLTSETTIIDVNTLQAGIYFMIIGDRVRETIKFIKQ